MVGDGGRWRSCLVWIGAVWLGAGCSVGLEENHDPSVATLGPTQGMGSETDAGSDGEGSGSGTGGESGDEGEDEGLDESGGEDTNGTGDPLDPVCGDGMVTGPEQCDNGAANSPSGDCTTQCTIASCGDGFVHMDEECDDGNNIDTDSCLSNCDIAECGDGVVQEGVELCDDGNLDENDGCTVTCTLASCGDGVVQPPEECDDGNASNADGCLSTCVPASCGDGWVQPPEQCDDGNGSNADACLETCEQASCGDGFVYVGVEECDGAGDPTVYSCSDTCQDQEVWYQWSFFQFNLPNPMACADFSTWRSVLADDHTSILLSGTYDMGGISCNGPEATQLCNALRLGGSTTVNCDGHNWHVGDCVGTMEVRIDGPDCDCSSPGYALRPCVPYDDWGGVATNTCAGPSQEIYIECGFD